MCCRPLTCGFASRWCARVEVGGWSWTPGLTPVAVRNEVIIRLGEMSCGDVGHRLTLMRSCRRLAGMSETPMTPLRDLLDAHGQEIRAIVRANRGRSVAVFGSVARGEEHEDSDIDLLVEFDEGASLFDQVRIGQSLSELLGRDIDVVSSRALLPEDDDIRADAVAL